MFVLCYATLNVLRFFVSLLHVTRLTVEFVSPTLAALASARVGPEVVRHGLDRYLPDNRITRV